MQTWHRRIGLAALWIMALAAAGCGSTAQTEETAGNREIAGFQPIPEDATVEALAAAGAAEQESSGVGTAAGEEDMDDAYGEQDGQAVRAGETENEEKEPFTMVFTGDVLLQSYTMDAYDRNGLDGLLSEELQEELTGADLTMVNEEFPFGVGGTAADKEYTFIADPSYVTALTDMGADIVSLANNHVLDYGKEVLSQTFETLDAAGVDYVGAGETPERAKAWISYDLNGTSAAFLSASRVIPESSWNVDNAQPGVFSTYDSAQLVGQIQAAKEENDLVVVYVHWGIEKAQTPESYQRQLARDYIDAGADLVIGTHPHVLQGIEYYNGVPIVYSLGNFIFNYTISQTAVLRVETDEAGDMTLCLIPAAASNAWTYRLEDDGASELFSYMESISYDVTIDADGVIHPYF